MKRFLSSVALLLAGSCGLAWAQDVVVADSTNVAEDELRIEESSTSSDDAVASENLQVAEVASDSLEIEEIEEIKEKPARGIYGSGVAKTWELQTEIVYNTSFDPDPIKDGDNSGGVQLTIGYNFNEHFLLGITAGYIHDFGGVTSFEAGKGVPFLGTFQFRWNTFPKVQFFVEGRAGIMLNIEPDHLTAGWTNLEHKDIYYSTMEYPNYQYYEINPGLMFHMSERYDVRFSAGYAYAKPGKEVEKFKYNTYEEHILSFKVGIARRF